MDATEETDLARALLSAGSATVTVRGRSMLPFVLPGATLIVEPVSEADVEVGDVVVFAQDGAYVVHRVVSVENGHVATRGDAHRAPDVARPGRRIIARARGLALLDRTWPMPTPAARAIGRMIADSGPSLLTVLVPVVRAAQGLRHRVRRSAGATPWHVTVKDEREVDARAVEAYFRERGIHRRTIGPHPSDVLALMAIHDARIVGSVHISPSDARVLVHDLYVLSAARGRGVGAALLEAVTARCSGASLHARIRMDNAPSKACFSRAGFACVDREGEIEMWVAEPGTRDA